VLLLMIVCAEKCFHFVLFLPRCLLHASMKFTVCVLELLLSSGNTVNVLLLSVFVLTGFVFLCCFDTVGWVTGKASDVYQYQSYPKVLCYNSCKERIRRMTSCSSFQVRMENGRGNSDVCV